MYGDIDFRTTLTREEMYEQAESLFERAVTPLNDVIENLNGKIDKSDLEGIVLLGGSTRIPKIKELLTEYLGKSVIKLYIIYYYIIILLYYYIYVFIDCIFSIVCARMK